ncbi:tetratricopeptide repeat protein 7B-like isoform X1 [Branchiostoma lanceolatum]|uniref:tetratricopeptide repeat protein 7B-like isoform X1 n=1 Tax=Branchiostoma lanceolatum TaxID=7740 RepID=UPI003454244B
MAARKPGRLELEVEKCRAEGNWTKAMELVRQLERGKHSGLESLVQLVLGETKLELHLQEVPPKEENIAKASRALTEARRHFNDALKGEHKQKWAEEILLLQGKLNYATGNYEDALGCFCKGRLEELSTNIQSNRILRLIAEAYALKAMCLEKVPLKTFSKMKQAEREEEIISLYEHSGDMALLYLQECEKGQKATPTVGGVTINNTDLGHVLETAIYRTPVLHLKNGDLSTGISRFREMLRAVEARCTQNLRQTLARQLSEVLLRSVCEKTYSPPVSPLSSETVQKRASVADVKVPGSSTASPSLRPKLYSSEGVFIPTQDTEESLLLLLLSEAIANREVVLSRAPEHKESRVQTVSNASAVYDLLTILLIRRSQPGLLAEILERTMKFGFDEFHLWFQFGLSLLAAGKHARAVRVLKECHTIQPDNDTVCLFVAKLCIEHLHQLEDAVIYSKKVIERDSKNNLGLRRDSKNSVDLQRDSEKSLHASRAFLMLGVAYSMQATEAKLMSARHELQKKALDAFNRSHTLDPDDHLALFHLGLQLALQRQIAEALQRVQQALQLRPDHLPSLHLLALLLSAGKQHTEARQLVDAALSEYPENSSLLFTKVKLSVAGGDAEEALVTCKHLLQLWKDTFEPTLKEEERRRGSGLIDKVMADKRSLAQIHITEFSDGDSGLHLTDTGSVYADSIAASKVEKALSEVASSLNSYTPKPGPQQAWAMQVHIWLNIADVYLAMGKVEDARACVQEAHAIFPYSHLVIFKRGCIHEMKHEYPEAKKCFSDATAINPSHVPSLQHLGMANYHLGNLVQGEKALRDAVNIDNTAHEAWANLGKVLEAQGDHLAATDCYFTSLELEASSPVVQFSIIPKQLH